MKHEEVTQIIESFLQRLGADVNSVECREGSVHPTYHINATDAPALIGVGGENLKALNLLVKKIVEKQLGVESTKFLLDINGYQRKKLMALEQQAKMLAERARTFKTAVAMEPVNAYERMVIHALFNDDREIYTESSGQGRERHIVFMYKAGGVSSAGDHTFLSDDS